MLTSQKRSIETEMIYDRIRKANINEVITYTELRALINADVQSDARRYLYTARNWALRDDNMVFGTIRNVGIKRITGDEVIGETDMALRYIHNKTNYALKVIKATDYDSFSPAGMKQQNARVALLGSINLFSEKKSVKKIEEQTNGKPLTIGRTLKLFR